MVVDGNRNLPRTIESVACPAVDALSHFVTERLVFWAENLSLSERIVCSHDSERPPARRFCACRLLDILDRRHEETTP